MSVALRILPSNARRHMRFNVSDVSDNSSVLGSAETAMQELMRWGPNRLLMADAVTPVAELFAIYSADALTTDLPRMSWQLFEAALDRCAHYPSQSAFSEKSGSNMLQ
jgi:hypothetical protein